MVFGSVARVLLLKVVQVVDNDSPFLNECAFFGEIKEGRGSKVCTRGQLEVKFIIFFS